MNFGAIGSIIGHEITHAFDDQASKLENWPEKARRIYEERVQCVINQFSSYRVSEVENYYDDEGEISPFFLNGNQTRNEDIADLGGVKLAFNAYKRLASKFPDTSQTPIGMHNFNWEQIFWLSFAQTYCRLVD